MLNSNDNPPIFEQEEYPASVVEYNALTSVGQTSGVITVHANDADGDDTVNGQVSYSITGGNSKGIFVVHEMVSTYVGMEILTFLLCFSRSHTLFQSLSLFLEKKSFIV